MPEFKIFHLLADAVAVSALLMGVAVAAFYVWRTYLRAPVDDDSYTNKEASPRDAKSVLVVLGSGGHTMEALEMMKTVKSSEKQPFRVTFVVASGDTASVKRVETMHREGELAYSFRFETVPRARSVGQSWLTTPLTTLLALPTAADIVLRVRPITVCSGVPHASRRRDGMCQFQHEILLTE